MASGEWPLAVAGKKEDERKLDRVSLVSSKFMTFVLIARKIPCPRRDAKRATLAKETSEFEIRTERAAGERRCGKGTASGAGRGLHPA